MRLAQLSFLYFSCEIIKDSVSKESLQYAFIEYENVSKVYPALACGG